MQVTCPDGHDLTISDPVESEEYGMPESTVVKCNHEFRDENDQITGRCDTLFEVTF